MNALEIIKELRAMLCVVIAYQPNIEKKISELEQSLTPTVEQEEFKTIYDIGMEKDLIKDLMQLIKVARNTIDINEDEQVLSIIENQLHQDSYTILGNVVLKPILQPNKAVEVIKKKKEEYFTKEGFGNRTVYYVLEECLKEIEGEK